MMKLSDYVIARVAELGVKHVFFVPGGGAMHLNDSLGSNPDVDYVSNHHEQASSICAEAYARVAGFGCCMITTGPGGTNAVTGLLGAWLDSTPCLFLSGQVKRADLSPGTGLRQLGVQEFDIVTLVGSITKYAVTVKDPEQIAYHLDEAFYLARTGRPGPVWIDIPLDVQPVMIDPAKLPRFTPPKKSESAKAGLKSQARATLALLAKAERPIFMVGNGVRIAGAVDAFQELVELLQIPIQTTWLGHDLIPNTHPLFAQRPGSIAPRAANFAVQNCDFFLSIGARLDMALLGYSHERFARAASKVVCDIDAAELRKLSMNIDIPVIADAKDFIDALIEVAAEFAPKNRSPWIARIQDWKERYPLLPPKESAQEKQISVYAFTKLLSDAIPENALIAPGSSGFGSEIFHLMFEAKKGQRMYHNRGTGSMGFALPSAIAACFASNCKKQVFTLDGDGGFQFNIQELATIAAHQLPIKCFVINNRGYASSRASQHGYFEGRLVGSNYDSGLKLPDIQAVVTAYGVKAHKIRYGDDVAAEIAKVLAMQGPVVCEVEVIPDESREPRLSSYRTANGSMASKPMEDLYPFLEREEFHANMMIPVIEE